MHMWRNIEALSRNNCCRRKAICFTYYECVFSSTHTTCAILSPVACLALPYIYIYIYIYISQYLIKGKTFEKKVIEHKMCVVIFSTIFVWNISHSKKNWVRYDVKCVFRYKVPVILSTFNGTWIFLTNFWNIFKYQIAWESIQWEPTCSLKMTNGWMDGWMDGWKERQTDKHDKAKSCLSQFCEHA